MMIAGRPPVPRISKDRLSLYMNELITWSAPQDYLHLVDVISATVPSSTFFNQSGLAFLRDAYVASRFAVSLPNPVPAVRVVPESERWPDFELQLADGTILPFEVVEADDPTRRRGDEYRHVNDEDVRVEDESVENWQTAARSAPNWIALAVRKKVTKAYGTKAHLVVHLANVSEYGAYHDEVVQSFDTAVSVGRDHFLSIWVLWKGRAYLTTPSTQDASGVLLALSSGTPK